MKKKKIEQPDLTKMESEELRRYYLKVRRDSYSHCGGTCDFSPTPQDKELQRVNIHIYSLEKKIVITEKDIADLIKRKMRMGDDRNVVVTGVGLICGRDKRDDSHRLSIEYYF